MKRALKLEVIEYTYETRERDWGSCQENDNSDSAYHKVTKTAWSIWIGNVLLLDGLSQYMAERLASSWKMTPNQIKKNADDMYNRFKKEQERLESRGHRRKA